MNKLNKSDKISFKMEYLKLNMKYRKCKHHLKSILQNMCMNYYLNNNKIVIIIEYYIYS